MTFFVTTHYPDHHDLTLYQRIALTWCERILLNASGEKEKVPRILVCDISNPHEKHDDDVIYPNNFQQIYRRTNAVPQASLRIHFHGADKADHFILSDTILFIEAAHGGKHCIVHTTDESVEVMATVAALEKKYERVFLRCHQSYLVNPGHIRDIRRFRVSLTDGTQLPIPEKKYTAFRDLAMNTLKRQEQP